MEEVTRDKRLNRLVKKDDKLFQVYTDLFTYELNGKIGEVLIPKPNLTAIYLGIGDKALENATKIYIDELESNFKYNEKSKIFTIALNNQERSVFDFFENIFISTVFYFMAVEAFVNSLIPADLRLTVVKNGELKVLNYEQIQRDIKLEEKIKKILPKAYKYEFHSNSFPSWRSFTDLKKFRDELVHLKKEIFSEGKSSQLKFIMEMIGRCIQEDILESARALIRDISKKVGNHPALPFEFCNQPIDINQLNK